MESVSVRFDEVAAAMSALRGAVAGDEAARGHLDVIESYVSGLARAEARLRERHAVLMRLAASERLGSGALDEAMREITEAAATVLSVARSSVWLYNADHTAIQCVDIFLSAERAHESGVELFAKDYPTYFDALREERSIAAHDAHTDPRTSCFSASYLTPLGIGAMLDAPVRAGGKMIGVVCNEHLGGARTWTAEDEQFAASIADFVALALETGRRRESEEQLRAMVEALTPEG